MAFDTTFELEDIADLGGEPTQSRDLRRQGMETLQRLLAAAREVVEERGHDEARVDDVMDLAGLAHGTFYLYFRDRDDLLRSLVRGVGRRLEHLADRLDGEPTASTLADWIEAAIAELDQHAEILRAARALGSDEAVAGLVAPVARWLGRVPDAVTPELSAGLLVWHVERAVVRDDIVDHACLAEAIMRSVGVATDGEGHAPAE